MTTIYHTILLWVTGIAAAVTIITFIASMNVEPSTALVLSSVVGMAFQVTVVAGIGALVVAGIADMLGRMTVTVTHRD